jgi:hypothetical protein
MMANLQAKSVISRGSEDLLRIMRGIDVDVLQRRNENKELWILTNGEKKTKIKTHHMHINSRKTTMLLAS